MLAADLKAWQRSMLEKMLENLGAAAPHPLRKDERVGELCACES